MSLEASQGTIWRVECRVCGRRLTARNRSGLCEYHRGTLLEGPRTLCRCCPAALTAANKSGYCCACSEATAKAREDKRRRDRARYKRNRAAASKIPCCHCKRRKAYTVRGLCWTCLQDPEVRVLFPSTSKFARKGGAMDDEENEYIPSPCPEPTNAIPGTDAKVAILEARLAARVELWHEDDVRFEHNSRGVAVFTGGDDADQDEDAD